MYFWSISHLTNEFLVLIKLLYRC